MNILKGKKVVGTVDGKKFETKDTKLKAILENVFKNGASYTTGYYPKPGVMGTQIITVKPEEKWFDEALGIVLGNNQYALKVE